MLGRHHLLVAVAATLGLVACTSDGPSEPTVLLELPDARPGDVVGLIPVETDDRRTIEWLDRIDGTIRSLDIDDADATPELVATINVGTDGEQRGLLGQVIVDDRRFASWTQPATATGDFEIVVGEVVNGGSGDIVWSGGRAGGGAIGGVLDELDGEILLGLGRNTAWDADTGAGGAFLAISPDASPADDGRPLSVGYTNPWAFTVTESGQLWFADNAAGPDPDDPSIDDIERIGRGDLIANRNELERITEPGRAPSAMVELADGRIGICGFLDNELRAYEIVEPVDDAADGDEPTALERAGTIMPCLTGAAVFSDGTIVTAGQGTDGETLQILRP